MLFLVNILVPPLVRTFRAAHFPATLRASALATLAQCVDTSPLSMLSWSDDLTSGIIDLLQLESVSYLPPITNPVPIHSVIDPPEAESPDMGTRGDRRLKEEDSIPPLAISAKIPTLRRAALHFISLLLRAAVTRTYASSGTAFESFDAANLERLSTVVGYVWATDQDGIARAQAEECVTLINQLGRAKIGLD